MVESKVTITQTSPLKRRVQYGFLRLQRNWRIFNLTRKVAAHSRPGPERNPVVMFNASTRLGGFSQNAAFSLLTTWGLQLASIPVVQFVCKGGMSRCVLGTDPDDHTTPPPCATCIAQSQRLLASAPQYDFTYSVDVELNSALRNLSIDELSVYEYPISNSDSPLMDRLIPLGTLVLPALRWALRRHHLIDDEPTRYLLREYILSAYHVAKAFDSFLDQVEPQVVVVFNGIMFPEATVRWIAKAWDIRVITHEVGFQPFSTFFTDGQATAYPIQIPDDFELTAAQESRLDSYLSQRLKGEFTMAGIRFWPEISGLDEDFNQHVAKFKQIVPVFTNVAFDTSQVHANTVFPNMFAWLDLLLEIIRDSEDTLFIIRAHPDEKRRGTRKLSRESVSDWVESNQVSDLPNVVFVDSQEPLSSYELIQRAKFLIVYNSSIGLEATLLDKAVVCGGKARYTQYPTVFTPKTPEEYDQQVREFLIVDLIDIPKAFQRNARRFLYYQLYRVSLSLDRFLSAHPTPGYVQLRSFSWNDLTGQRSPTMKVLIDGIVNEAPFLLPDDG